ncbi:MAG: hypothetical protein ACOCY9_00125 [Desulfohalobiaceae bacterium]
MNNNHRPTCAPGAALILVLAVLLAVSGLSLRATELTTRTSEAASRLILEYQAGIKAETGLQISLDILAQNEQGQDILPVQAQDMSWQDRGLQVNITPCSAKLNINALLGKSSDSSRMQQALQDILDNQGLPRADLDHLLYWIGALDSAPADFAASNAQQTTAWSGLDFTAPGRDLQRPEELLLIPGFEQLPQEWVREQFTVWGQPGRINLNYASQEVALALLPELEPYWDRITSMRQDTGLTHPNQLLTEIGLDMTTYQQILGFLSWQPTHFEIHIESQVGSWYKKYRYIVQKEPINTDSGPQVLVKDILHSGQK